ncbi:MAG: hypothetical protein HGA63_03955, partial [Syntrophobacteraceae bacterium]|nr:hypothetical protein [Syntrophobacteraceae bacterium]
EAPSWLPFQVRTALEIPPEFAGDLPVRRQTLLEMEAGQGVILGMPTVVTEMAGSGEDWAQCVVRRRHRAALLLQTQDGRVEWEMAREAMCLGMEVEAVAAATEGGMSFPTHETARFFYRMGRFRWASPLDLWKKREADLFLSPFAGQIPPDLQQGILEDTGRLAQLWFPHIPQALPVTRNPLLMQFSGRLARIFTKHPQLMDAEAETARELLRDIPRNHALIHARYRHMAIASGHSACPSCAEVQVLALPVYMSIAMSLARGQVPGVSFTCETGCMSETLNKVNEVAQKVPGGRTVFGGGFAFGEAIAMAQDRAVRMGHLPRGRRYVVSQGGDGGAVIGLPAFLNALRQQAFLIHQRHANTLHFINITDTQVYSNTGGESSASSLLGLGTLTTPIGKFLMGNQKIQWNLINLAAEFPGILVGAGHSGDKAAMQEFWQLADQLGQSAIRWDVTPCPETGKFFGEDPDDLAEVMAHAGMLPQVVFVGRFRKRVAPIHPEDRGKLWSEWRKEPKPVQYWMQRDPRYRELFRKNPQSGTLEPRNTVAHFLVAQLESYRDQLNWQIDLETRMVRQTEEWVASFFQELKGMWNHHCYQLEEFRYSMLFNSQGELKPEYRGSLEQDMVRRVLGWEPLSRYAARRDDILSEQRDRIDQAVVELERLDGLGADILETPAGGNENLQEVVAKVAQLSQTFRDTLGELKVALVDASPVDPLEEELFSDGTPGENPPSVPEIRREELFRILDRILDERALATQVELQQYRLAQHLKKEFMESGGIVRTREAVEAAAERSRLREHIGGTGPFALGVASLAGDRGIAINRVFAQFFTAKGAWAGMAWQFGSSKRGTPVLSATFVDAKPLHRKDAMHSFPMAVLIVTNYEEMKQNPDLFFGRLQPGGYLIINNRKPPQVLWEDLVGRVPESRRRAVEDLRGHLGRGREGHPGAGASDASGDGDPQGQDQ